MAKGGGTFRGPRAGKIPPAVKAKISTNMGEMKAGRLHSGSKSGPLVKNPKQAVAISYNQVARGRK